MVSLRVLLLCLLAVHGAKKGLRGQHARTAPQEHSPEMRTLLALDTNHDGKVDPLEVAAFAKAQGFDAAQATQEFSGLDQNGDGMLDMQELGGALSTEDKAADVTDKEEDSDLAAIQAQSPPAVAEAPKAAPVVKSPAHAAAKQQQTHHAAKRVSHSRSKTLLLKVAPEAKSAPATPSSATEESRENGLTVVLATEKKTGAEAAASLFAEELHTQTQKEEMAREHDRQAAEKRASAASIVRSTSNAALQAGTDAARSTSEKMLAALEKLEKEAEEKEVKAAALRAKSKEELRQANELMMLSNAAIKGV